MESMIRIPGFRYTPAMTQSAVCQSLNLCRSGWTSSCCSPPARTPASYSVVPVGKCLQILRRQIEHQDLLVLRREALDRHDRLAVLETERLTIVDDEGTNGAGVIDQDVIDLA